MLFAPSAPTSEIVRRKRRGIRHRLVKPQLDAELATTVLENVDEPDPRDAGKVVAANGDPFTAVDDVDVVPFLARRSDRLVGRRIALAQVVERLVGKNDPPPERVVRPVALDHRHLVRRILSLHEQREVQTRRTAANDQYAHSGVIPSRVAGRGARARFAVRGSRYY